MTTTEAITMTAALLFFLAACATGGWTVGTAFMRCREKDLNSHSDALEQALDALELSCAEVVELRSCLRSVVVNMTNRDGYTEALRERCEKALSRQYAGNAIFMD